jgi:hypothetical protein
MQPAAILSYRACSCPHVFGSERGAYQHRLQARHRRYTTDSFLSNPFLVSARICQLRMSSANDSHFCSNRELLYQREVLRTTEQVSVAVTLYTSIQEAVSSSPDRNNSYTD